MNTQLPLVPLESFDCDSDNHNIGSKWEKWKRGLILYLEAANIEEPKKKRATMLHVGGLGLQEIYYNLPGAHAADTDESGNDVFNIAVQKLDEYFTPKRSYVYERHLFRIMKQEPEEKFEKFMIRLRKQATRCGFTKLEENLIDQITEKCCSEELRKKILKAGDSVTLKEIIIEANTLENVKYQLEDFSQTPSNSNVSMISTNSQNNQKKNVERRKTTKRCYRCGSLGHRADFESCPGRKETCRVCGRIGHYSKFCLSHIEISNSSATKRELESTYQRNDAKKPKRRTAQRKEQVNEIEEADEPTEIDYVF